MVMHPEGLIEVESAGFERLPEELRIRLLDRAVTIAGGFTERASQSKIFVVRDNDPTHTPAKVDLDAPIYPGDIITVEESFF